MSAICQRLFKGFEQKRNAIANFDDCGRNKPFQVVCDASNSAINSAFMQYDTDSA